MEVEEAEDEKEEEEEKMAKIWEADDEGGDGKDEADVGREWKKSQESIVVEGNTIFGWSYLYISLEKSGKSFLSWNPKNLNLNPIPPDF